MTSIEPRLVRQAPESDTKLLRFLRSGLQWPIPADFDDSELLIDFSPDELHLDPSRLARLTKIRQIPKLDDSQDFAAFILNFDGGQLPQGAIRRLVARLVRTGRAKPGRQIGFWNLDDIIFFCTSDDGEPTIHIVSFREVEDRTSMKVISWSCASTDNHIALLAERQLPDLIWGDLGVTVEARDRAFAYGYRHEVRSARDLAEQMADVAKEIKRNVLGLLKVETDTGPTRSLFASIKKELDESIQQERFADMYAQTLVYGLLAARITNPSAFGLDALRKSLTFQSPFLDAIYENFRRSGEEALDLDELGLRDLASTLGVVDVEGILANFGAEEIQEDPVVYFYAVFLERYSPQQRKDLGAYYTPVPLVRFMTRAIDEVLRDHCGLSGGITDPTTWEQHASRFGYRLPTGIDPQQRVLRVVDPATGTGTFLLEWIRQAESRTVGSKKSPLCRMDALEISLASYSVAHLKVDLALATSQKVVGEANIRLADTLAGKRELELFNDGPIAAEGHAADQIRKSIDHTVCVGNPPYDRVERSASRGFLFQSRDEMSVSGKSLFDDILDPAREHTIFSHQASLYNLYVYFWRWAIHKVFEQREVGPGVVCFVAPNSWLTGPGFLGLRLLARQRADEILVVDLGGDNIGAVKEENIFPIKTPVAVVILVRKTGVSSGSLASVRLAKISGTKKQKLKKLEDTKISDLPFTSLTLASHEAWQLQTGDATWLNHPELKNLLPWQQPGCMWNRTWPIAPEASTLASRWRRLLRSSDLRDRAACFVTAKTGRSIHTQVASLASIADLGPRSKSPPVLRYGFRSFDRQWVIADPRISSGYRPVLWDSLGPKQIFLASLMTGQMSDGPAMTCFIDVPDKHCFHGRGGKDLLPVYRDKSGTPNSDPKLLERLGQIFGVGLKNAVTHESLVAYIFGVLAGTDYATRYSEELKVPGPRVPITKDSDLFMEMVEFGENLLWLQTFGMRRGSSSRQQIRPADPIRWFKKPTRIPNDSKDFRFDESSETLIVADGTLMGVTSTSWNFKVSGMPVMKKWLSYRTAKGAGKAISSKSPLDKIRPKIWDPEWCEELRLLVHILQETERLRPLGSEILDRIVAGELVDASELPLPPQHLVSAPSAEEEEADLLESESETDE